MIAQKNSTVSCSSGEIARRTSLVRETSGSVFETLMARDVTLNDPFDPLSIETLTDATAINGRIFTTVLDRTGAVSTRTRTTPAGRTTITELDSLGRPTRIEIVGLVGGVTPLAPTVME